MHRDRVAIFTICSNNYLPFAHVLFESVRRFHPDADLFLCLADRLPDIPGLADGDWTVVQAHLLPIPNFPSFAFRYDIMEFNTALKPFMFLHLIEQRGYRSVLYFDPDIELFAPLTTILATLRDGASFLFTPHLCSPNQASLEPNDITILRAGTFNLGFLGVSYTTETVAILQWWARRLRFQCVNDQPAGLFVDQKFMNLVPGFADHAVISHDTSLNVAYWNLAQRQLAQTTAGWTVDGAPLKFFHFSGFNPHQPDRLSKHDPRFTNNLAEPLRQLTAHYAAALLERGYGTIPASTYAYGRFTNGRLIGDHMRKNFRARNSDGPSDPFDGFEASEVSDMPGRADGAGDSLREVT